jgi:hypothetical protein
MIRLLPDAAGAGSGSFYYGSWCWSLRGLIGGGERLLCPIWPKLDRDPHKHGQQGSEVEYEVFVMFLVKVPDPFKPLATRRKGRSKFRLY